MEVDNPSGGQIMIIMMIIMIMTMISIIKVHLGLHAKANIRFKSKYESSLADLLDFLFEDRCFWTSSANDIYDISYISRSLLDLRKFPQFSSPI